MNKIMKKIYLSVLTLGLTVVALGTTTFAWFTLTNQAQVEDFQLQVVADQGIEFRLARPIEIGGGSRFDETKFPETRWVTQLTTQMILDFIEEEYPDFRLNEVTSPDGVAINTITGDPAASGSYLVFDLDFRSNEATTIGWDGVSISSPGVPFVSSFDFTAPTGQPVVIGQNLLLRAAHATRVSMQQVNGDTTAVAPTVVYELGDGTGDLGDNVRLGGFDYNTDGVFATEWPNGAISYFLAATNELPFGADVESPDPGGVVVVDTVSTLGTGVAVLNMDGNPLAGNATGDDTTTVTFTNSGTVRVRIYLEGWDPDMFNAILNDIITISLSFNVID